MSRYYGDQKSDPIASQLQSFNETMMTRNKLRAKFAQQGNDKFKMEGQDVQQQSDVYGEEDPRAQLLRQMSYGSTV